MSLPSHTVSWRWALRPFHPIRASTTSRVVFDPNHVATTPLACNSEPNMVVNSVHAATTSLVRNNEPSVVLWPYHPVHTPTTSLTWVSTPFTLPPPPLRATATWRWSLLSFHLVRTPPTSCGFRPHLHRYHSLVCNVEMEVVLSIHFHVTDLKDI